MGGFGGSPVTAAAVGGAGAGGVLPLILYLGVPATTATNLAAATFAEAGFPYRRVLADLRRVRYATLAAYIAGATGPIAAANKLRVDYHLGGDLNVAEADTGWRVLLLSTGSHTDDAWNVTAATAVPTDARIERAVLRLGFYDGDGAADPQYWAAHLLLT